VGNGKFDSSKSDLFDGVLLLKMNSVFDLKWSKASKGKTGFILQARLGTLSYWTVSKFLPMP
jgi:hypothetical protein